MGYPNACNIVHGILWVEILLVTIMVIYGYRYWFMIKNLSINPIFIGILLWGNSVAENVVKFDNGEIRTVCFLNEAVNVYKHCKHHNPAFGLLSLVTGTMVDFI